MSDTAATPSRHTVPIQRGQYECKVTPPWFVNGSEYQPKPATFRPLVNGEEAFRAVHEAIAKARKSVCIICWGFQPSMYFIRDGKSPSIGQLLELKARQGVMVRVLCWALTDTLTINVTGAKGAPKGEPNTPGRQIVGLHDKPFTETDQQYAYDEEFYRVYDRKQSGAGELRRRYFISDDYPKDKLLFTSRSLSVAEQSRIATMSYVDKKVSMGTRAALAGAATHHQKMVIVDHEEPDHALGFVMGHNSLDAYWDTQDHGWQRHRANLGRNGETPRHDYSSCVTGPILGDLFNNFAVAWARETDEKLPVPDFNSYPVVLESSDCSALCQILRTQVQVSPPRQDIMKGYLQAVSNATQCIHIENQYFRWPPLADKIKACAAGQTASGRKPETHGSLYLFVISNTSEDGMGDGTINTYRMLDSLGRADTIPEVTRTERLQDIDDQLAQNKKAMKPLLSQREAIDSDTRLLGVSGEAANERYTRINERLAPLEERQRKLEEAKASLSPLTEQERAAKSSRKPDAIMPAEIPGLKVHIATLVAPDTPEGKPWQEVYIHAKLMIVDDTFMTLGSANINTRSMQTDSELNIIHERHEISGALRRKQVAKYTAGGVMDQMPLSETYKVWAQVMSANTERRGAGLKPVAQLAEFKRTDPKISNTD